MSHQPERKEKNCLNCGTEVAGRYCQICGQENIVPHQTFWALASHFIFDIFHFDGKFFDSVRYLLFRPGFVAKEYVQGRRTRYLDPIRMYLFTSAIFFLIFLSTQKKEIKINGEDRVLNKTERMELAMDFSGRLKQNGTDTSAARKLGLLLDSTQTIVLTDTVPSPFNAIVFKGKAYGFNARFDSSEIKRKMALNKDSWIERQLSVKNMEFEAKYGDDLNAGINELAEKFLHRLHYLLFLSLPFFALILKLLYRRQAFYYSDHAVFTLYHYIFSFLILLLFFAFLGLYQWSHMRIFSILNTLLFFWWAIYLFLGLKSFYGQGWGKTLAKFLLLNFLGIVCLLLLFVVFILFSVSEI